LLPFPVQQKKEIIAWEKECLKSSGPDGWRIKNLTILIKTTPTNRLSFLLLQLLQKKEKDLIWLYSPKNPCWLLKKAKRATDFILLIIYRGRLFSGLWLGKSLTNGT